MTGFQQLLIGGYPGGGLTKDKKPAFLANEAFSELQNAYVFRDRTKKRDGDVPMGRLSRVFIDNTAGTTGTSPWTFNIYSQLVPVIAKEENAEIEPGSVRIEIDPMPIGGNIIAGPFSPSVQGYTLATDCEVFTDTLSGLTTGDFVTISGVVVNPGTGPDLINGGPYQVEVIPLNTSFKIGVDSHTWGSWASGGTWAAETGTIVFTDNGNGTLSSTTPGNSGVINYMTGNVTLIHTAGAGVDVNITFSYFPSLPVMGIIKRDVPIIGVDSTVFFDTKYAYQYAGGFVELVPGTTWTGKNTNFFCGANYQGSTPDLRYFFVTNGNIDISSSLYDPIRYYNNSTWTDLQPLVSATDTLWQALILIPYYGRMVALNTWEGPTSGTYTGAKNFFARCRFSQLGDPTQPGSTGPYVPGSWASDVFGKGGFIDAPTNEAIVGAAFFRNTLIVFFEYSTWQLRYVGEYGLPFIWERISSDFGSVSTFSSVVFDQGVMSVSNRGIVQASAGGIQRLDDQIPEQIFSFEIQNNAPNFVHGVRDFEKELVYWNYLDTSSQALFQTYPNTVLVFNYKNNTWAKFRDTITCFGSCQFQFGITWDSFTTLWESNVNWDNVNDQNYIDYVTCGTQQGFINIYQNPDAETPQPVSTLYAQTLAITNVSFNPTRITIPKHNLAEDEIIYIQGAIFDGADPGLNSIIYNVTTIDENTVSLFTWDFNSQSYDEVDIQSTAVYLGGGRVTLFPKMNIQGKDFNPFQNAGKQFKLSYIDFQMDANVASPAITATTVQLFVNSFLNEQANVISSNQEIMNSSQACGFITHIAQSNPCRVTSPGHSLITGSLIYIANVQGMTQINSAIYSITVVDANNFTLDNINSSGFGAYITGGIWNTSPINGQTYTRGSQYAWYRFYSTQYGQYLRIGLTYDDNLMNQLATHQTPMELNAMNIWFREGGRIVN